MEKLKDLEQALMSNLKDGDHSSIENNAYSLLSIAKEQAELINKFKSLVDMDMGKAIEELIRLSI